MKIKELIYLVKGASRHKNIISQLFDLLHHKLAMNTSPIDYYRFHFYKNSFTREQKERFLGKRGSCFYPWQANKVQYTPLFDNKYIFKIMLKGFDLPQPKYITAIGQNYPIKKYEQFEKFLAKHTSSIVLKPLDGSGGQGIFVLSFKNHQYYILDDACSAKEIWSRIREGRKPYLVEEHVEQIALMSNMHPQSLNTLRIVTIKAKDLKWHLVGTWMRIGQGKAQVDNLGAGGIALGIDLNGKIYYAFDWHAKMEISSHPDTGLKLIGIDIPLYHEAIELALKASEKFGFMGTVGWDIGLSLRGPVIIEGNIFYDVEYWQHGNLGPFIPSHLTCKLDRRKWWQRWDKTAMHPKVDRYNIRA
jgi:Sugar-transfer associated ATP-grasp